MNFFAKQVLAEWVQGLGKITLLAKESLQSLFMLRVSWRDYIYQLYFIGVKSQSVVLVTGAFTGMVLTAQTYFQFHKVKMDNATLAVVSVSMSPLAVGAGVDRADGGGARRRLDGGGIGHHESDRAD